MPPLPRLAAFLAALPLLCGCAAAGRYLEARGLDLADLVQANAGCGPGLLASAKASEFCHVAAGYAVDRKAGIVGRHAGVWTEENLGFPVTNVGEWHYAPGRRLLSALTCFQAREVGPFVSGDAEFFWRRLDSRCGATRSPWIDRFDLEAGGTVLFVNLRVGVSPGQLFDFLAGLFTLDPAGDDPGPEKAHGPVEYPSEPDK